MSGEFLKQCPFCMSQPEATKRVGRRFIVECDFCSAVGPRRSTRDGAADAWNLRSVPIIAAPDAPVSMCSRCHATWPLDQAPSGHYVECTATPAPITPSAVSGATLSDAQLRAIAECARIHWTDPRLPQLVALIQGIGVPSAVDEAERRGAERATAQVVAWLRREADKFAKQADDMTMGSWQRRVFMSGASEYLDVAMYIERGHHIPPATESEAGRG